MLGALGHGTHHGVLAGTVHKAPLHHTYYSGIREYSKLMRHQRKLQLLYLTRDAVFDNKFAETARVNGVFRLPVAERRALHMEEIMPALRRRSIHLYRLRRQNDVNARLVQQATQMHADDPRNALVTPDSSMYFMSTSEQRRLKAPVTSSSRGVKGPQPPQGHLTHNAWPNFWQHPSRKAACVPVPRWERHPELGGITRVHDHVAQYSSHY
jgi:hypothetical protein